MVLNVRSLRCHRYDEPKLWPSHTLATVTDRIESVKSLCCFLCFVWFSSSFLSILAHHDDDDDDDDDCRFVKRITQDASTVSA